MHPFDLKDDVVWYFVVARNSVKRTSVKVSSYISDKFKKYVMKPIKIVGKFLWSKIRWVGRQVKYSSDLFI